jgi:hypothetical protein
MSLKAPKRSPHQGPHIAATRELDKSEVEPIVKPKSGYKNLCHSLNIDKYASEKKKKTQGRQGAGSQKGKKKPNDFIKRLTYKVK